MDKYEKYFEEITFCLQALVKEMTVLPNKIHPPIAKFPENLEVPDLKLDGVKIINLSEVTEKLKHIQEELQKKDNKVEISKMPRDKEQAQREKDLLISVSKMVTLFEKLTANSDVLVKAKGDKVTIDFPSKPTEAIPVQLSDGKKFYNALASVISGGGGRAISAEADNNLKELSSKLDEIITNTSDLELLAETINLNAESINLNVDGVESKLEDVKTKQDTLNAKDFATETTLALIKAKTDNIPTDPSKESGKLTEIANNQVEGKTFVKKTVDFSASQTAQAIWTPATGKKFVITDFLISVSAGGTITIFDNTDDTTNRVAKLYLATNGGAPMNYRMPFISSTNNNVLKYTTGAGIAGSITVSGYEV